MADKQWLEFLGFNLGIDWTRCQLFSVIDIENSPARAAMIEANKMKENGRSEAVVIEVSESGDKSVV